MLPTALTVPVKKITPTPKATNKTIPWKVKAEPQLEQRHQRHQWEVRRICPGNATMRRDHLDQDTASPRSDPDDPAQDQTGVEAQASVPGCLRIASIAPA